MAIQHALVDILARCGTVSLAQLVAASCRPHGAVVDALVALVVIGRVDIWRDAVDQHIVVGYLPFEREALTGRPLLAVVR